VRLTALETVRKSLTRVVSPSSASTQASVRVSGRGWATDSSSGDPLMNGKNWRWCKEGAGVSAWGGREADR
jgi:hypothetical protein